MNYRATSYFLAMAVAIMAAVSCSSVPEDQYQDPFEPLNRQVFRLNDGVDQVVIVPVTKVYTSITPDPVETGVSNFFDNLNEPVVATNQLLQGKPVASFESVGRFGINSTVGILGLFDVASAIGVEAGNEDFGQTFAKWGFGSGPYIVLPLFGGSTLREGIGRAAAAPASPVFWLEDDQARLAFQGGQFLDASGRLLEERDLIRGDRYLFVRDAYFQRREFLITDGKATEEDPFLDD